MIYTPDYMRNIMDEKFHECECMIKKIENTPGSLDERVMLMRDQIFIWNKELISKEGYRHIIEDTAKADLFYVKLSVYCAVNNILEAVQKALELYDVEFVKQNIYNKGISGEFLPSRIDFYKNRILKERNTRLECIKKGCSVIKTNLEIQKTFNKIEEKESKKSIENCEVNDKKSRENKNTLRRKQMNTNIDAISHERDLYKLYLQEQQEIKQIQDVSAYCVHHEIEIPEANSDELERILVDIEKENERLKKVEDEKKKNELLRSLGGESKKNSQKSKNPNNKKQPSKQNTGPKVSDESTKVVNTDVKATRPETIAPASEQKVKTTPEVDLVNHLNKVTDISYQVHPRVERWVSAKPAEAAQFFDMINNVPVKQYETLSEPDLKKQIQYHSMTSLLPLLANQESLKNYTFPTSKGRGLFVQIVERDEITKGIVTIGIDETTNTIYHLHFKPEFQLGSLKQEGNFTVLPEDLRKDVKTNGLWHSIGKPQYSLKNDGTLFIEHDKTIPYSLVVEKCGK